MKKWKHKICLLLCAAILLCACGKKTYTDPLEYVTDNIKTAATLQNDTFAVFAKVDKISDSAVTRYALPKELGVFSEIQKVGQHWYLVDVVEKQSGYRDAVAIYILKDDGLVKLFDKSQAAKVYEYEYGVDIFLRGEVDGKLHFVVTRAVNSLAPKNNPLYIVDPQTGELTIIPHEKDTFTYPPIKEYDHPVSTDAGFGELYLTAKEYNTLYEKNNKIDKQTIFPPENQAAENKQVARALTVKTGDFDRPLMLPLADNANYANMYATDEKNWYVAKLTGYTNDNSASYSEVLIYGVKENTFYSVAANAGSNNIRMDSFIDGSTLAVLDQTNLLFIDLTKI